MPNYFDALLFWLDWLALCIRVCASNGWWKMSTEFHKWALPNQQPCTPLDPEGNELLWYRLIGENINCTLNQPIDKVVTSTQYTIEMPLNASTLNTGHVDWVNIRNFRPHLFVLFSIKMLTNVRTDVTFPGRVHRISQTRNDAAFKWNNVKGFSFPEAKTTLTIKLSTSII